MTASLKERAQRNSSKDDYSPKTFAVRLSKNFSGFLTWLRDEGVDVSDYTRLCWQETDEYKEYEGLKQKWRKHEQQNKS